jgi:hypothetical protein
MKQFLSVLSAIAFVCLPATVRSEAPPVNIPLPGGMEVPARLNVSDESGASWKSLPVTLMPSTNGFSATVSTPAGSTTVEGAFEVQGKSVRCSVKWEGAGELPDTFMMLLLMFPAEQVGEATITSAQGNISVAKLMAGESGRVSLDQAASFAIGPVDGHEIAFSCDSPMDVGVVVTGLKDVVHVRLGLTPHKTALPASGSVVWTMSE